MNIDTNTQENTISGTYEDLAEESWMPSPAGSLAQARAGQSTLPVDEIIRHAWSRVSGFKAQVWGSMLALMLVQIGIVLARLLTVDVLPSYAATPFFSVARFLVAPFGVWIALKGVSRMSGDEVLEKSLGKCFTVSTIVTAAGVGILSSLGLMLFVLPGVYIFCTCYMAAMLAADRELAPIEAVKISYFGLRGNVLSILRLQLICFVVVLVSAIPFGIGLIWSVPWAVCVQGETFRRTFGVETLDSM